MDRAGRVLGPRALGNGPRPDLVLADREEGDEPEQGVAVAEHPVDRGFLQAEVGQKGALLVAGELGHLGLENRGDPADPGPRALGDGLEPEALDHAVRLADRALLEVQAMEDGLLREKGEPPHRPGVVRRERHRPERPLALELGLQADEDRLLADLELLSLLLDRRLQALQPPLDHLEIGQDQLGLEVLDVTLGRRRAERLVGEGADHVKERVRVPELLGVEAGALALRDTRQVHDLEGGVGRLLRLEQGREPIDTRIGHARHPGVQLGAAGIVARGGDAGAGQQVEQRGLPRLRKADQSDLHGRIMPGVVSSGAL